MSSTNVYMLDTNIIAYIANGRSLAARRSMNHEARYHTIAASAISQGETLYGLARKPEAQDLHVSVIALLGSLKIFSWDSAAASSYGVLRAQLTAMGKTLSPLDTLIAAHAISIDAILVTHDKAFLQVQGLSTVDWATDL